jgi:enamine deaminase RidA (YjgF/YER057c/UK114 family)
MTPEEKLSTLGYELPSPPRPIGRYRLVVRTGENLFLTSGILPMKGKEILGRGPVGRGSTLKEAQEAAIQCLLNALAIFKEEIISLDRVEEIVRLEGYIASAPDFFEHPEVLNPACELLYQLFGEKGIPSRVAIGVLALPLNAVVELSLLVRTISL